MSTPIISCMLFKAALGDEQTYAELIRIMKNNYEYGHWSQYGCNCDPPCPKPTQEQCDALNARMELDLKDAYEAMMARQAEEAKLYHGEPGEPETTNPVP